MAIVTTRMTDAVQMIMPSAVSSERTRLARSASHENRKASARNISSDFPVLSWPLSCSDSVPARSEALSTLRRDVRAWLRSYREEGEHRQALDRRRDRAAARRET